MTTQTQAQTTANTNIETLYAAVELALAAAPDWGAEEGAESIYAGMDGQGRPIEGWNRRVGWSFARRARAAADVLSPGLLRGEDFPIAITTEELAEFSRRAIAVLAPFSPTYAATAEVA